MPGILPMKVIKVGTNAQSRIAQACDRCRSKKIRCDGVRPCCSQCANVGFECKTSDKLSRRAFPRGYTESLEERVRGLETEVRELKDLLDEKDEKIDLLTRLRSQSTKPIQLPSPRRSSTTQSPEAKDTPPEPDDSFKVQQSPYLLDGDGSDSYFAGTSSGRTFVDAFKHKVQEMGRSTEEIDTDKLLATSVHKPSDETEPPRPQVVWKAPARMVSDRLVNVFFQEWAPLYPVLHKLSFLSLYERYATDSSSVTDYAELAQLNLVFGIAALSSGNRASDDADLESFESQWKAAVDSILKDTSMQTLQVLVLAQIFCIQQGDLARVLTYKGISTTLSARLGLHQSQKRFALGTLTCETRKKVFWTLYTVDCFTAVTLGLPKHIKDDDVHCEYPVDADDENISERGFQPTLPGESTKLSSALALFRAARVLSKVLEEVFPAKATYDLSLKKLADLSDELENWSSSLAPHLRLQFAQDKPSTGTISSRSPILSLTYHYIRALIHRPAICASLGQRSSSSMITLSSSCKSIIQILQLLNERTMSFSFSMNRDELLVLSGMGLLFQGLNLESNSKMLKDNRKMLEATMDMLDNASAPCATEYRKVVTSFGPVKQSPSSQSSEIALSSLPRYKSDSPVATRLESSSSESLHLSSKKQHKAFVRPANGSSNDKTDRSTLEQRRATVHNIPIPGNLAAQRSPSLQSASSLDPSSLARSEPARSPANLHSRPSSTVARPSAPPQQQQHSARSKQRQYAPQFLNLDYLSFGNEPESELAQSSANNPIKTEPGPTAWERLLGNIDNGDTNIYDATYGGQPVEVLVDVPPLGGNLGSVSSNSTAALASRATPAVAAAASTNSSATVAGADTTTWAPDFWTLCPTDSNISSHSSALTSNNSLSAASVLSYSSDEGLGGHSPHDDFTVTGDWTPVTCPPTARSNSTAARAGDDSFRAIVIPDLGDGEEFGMLSPWGDGLNV